MSSLFDSVSFAHGPAMKNRFMLAPLTNQQSHPNGVLSDEEYRWLTMRAQGGFGLTMTAASHVQAIGQGFPGQIGCFSDDHIPGLTRLASGIRTEGSLAIVQLHHAGRRSPRDLIGTDPVAPGPDEPTGSRALTNDEVHGLIADFITAAKRCVTAGFDGVELHGAHDYILCEFLNAELNTRTDEFGGTIENRARIIFDIAKGIRATTREDFHLALRLSPELFGLKTRDIVTVYEMAIDSELFDLVDLSLWSTFKEASDPDFAGQRLIDLFAPLERKSTRLAVAGKLYHAHEMREAIEAGADMVALGRVAITNHNVPDLVRVNPDFSMRELPVSRATLAEEGLSETFINYMAGWNGFVAD
jgi:2,4-dienoyl-CoA reductase-like NADH-dependent reductase (Old Yellow Enzyme family)